MNEFDIPIFKKAYDLYKTLYSYRGTVPKQDRFTIWPKCENTVLDLVEAILLASQSYKAEKLLVLNKANLKLNFVRVFVRLMKEIRTIDNKKYTILQEMLDEIGRMLGGWIKSSKDYNP